MVESLSFICAWAGTTDIAQNTNATNKIILIIPKLLLIMLPPLVKYAAEAAVKPASLQQT
jgi:hypothetical protein